MGLRGGVFIGRFQPFHRGHVDVIKQALEVCDRVTVILGSSRSARSIRNPFLASEREEIIRVGLLSSGVSRQDLERLSIKGVRDYFYNTKSWIGEVREKAREMGVTSYVLFGVEKDATSSYLKWFPDWQRFDHTEGMSREEKTGAVIHATGLREEYLRDADSLLSHKGSHIGAHDLPEGVRDWLKSFSKTATYRMLHEEQKAIDEYRRIWKVAPFPPVFVTTDALVIQAGHILLIQRKKSPGKGLWALPGGFLDPGENLAECAARELFEETEFPLSQEALLSHLKTVKTFDHPMRSTRGRTITHVHHFDLPGDRVSDVKASDDAAQAKWLPVLDVAKMEEEFFEDHFHIIQSFINQGAMAQGVLAR